MTESSRPRLLVRLGSLGDVVLSTAVAEAWKRDGVESIDVLVKQEWSGIWAGHPAVRNVYGWAKEDRSWQGWQRLARQLRDNHYELAADLQSSPRTRSLLAWAGIPVIRPKRHGLRRRALVQFKRGGPPDHFRVARSFLRAAQADLDVLPRIYPLSASLERASQICGAGVGLAPGARHATKQWPVERFVEVGRHLARRQQPVPVFLDPGDSVMLACFRSLWPETHEWVPVQEPLEVAAAALSGLDGLVSGDTGLMHMAAAVGTPVIALFGPTVEAFGFFPAGSGHQVLQLPLGCRPCSVHGGSKCPQKHFRCLMDIPVSRVVAAVDNIPAKTVRVGPRSV